MSIVLLVITDGRRDCISRTIPSALANLVGPVTRHVIYDDSGDDEHFWWLRSEFPAFEVVRHPAGRQGFGGAIRAAWVHIGVGDERFVFHLEDDFTFNRPVNLEAMAHVLDVRPHLVQLALRRQPWNPQERIAGGVVEQHPDDYVERRGIERYPAGEHIAWLEHSRFFTTNPSLYRRSLCLEGWPDGQDSEGHFSHQILARYPDARFAFWGSRDSGEAVTHIGLERAGIGY